MQLFYVDELGRREQCDVAEAVQLECNSTIDDSGVLENMVGNHTGLTRMVGLLIQHLYAMGHIDEDFLLGEMLQNGYQKEE